MQIKAFTKDQLEIYFRWYNFYHKKGFPNSVRCNNIIAVWSDEQQAFGAGIMVQPIQNSVCCIFSFLTRNPFCDREFSSEAVDFLVQNLGSFAKSMGYATFVSMIGEQAAKARFKKNGVKEVETGLSMFYGEC